MNDVIPTLPEGVLAHTTVVEDSALQQSYPINQTAAIFFALVDGRRSLTTISQTLADRYQQPFQQVHNDLVVLCQQLEHHYLLNLYEGWQQEVLRWIVCFRHFILPRLKIWRYAIPPTTSYTRILIHMYGVVLRTFLPLLGLLALIITLFGQIVGHIWIFIGCYILVCATFILGVALHEASHLVATRWFKGKQYGFVISIGPSIRVIRPKETNIKQEMVISLLGPLTPTFIAVILIVYHIFVPFWVNWVFISIFGIHVLQLVFPNPDLGNIARVMRWHMPRARR